jgi:predicted MFS family arabinose efflux permease
MVLAAPTVLPYVPPGRRGLAGGVIFTGVGLGIAASGTLVPLLMRVGLVETWCGLGALALGLTVLAWPGWPEPATCAVATHVAGAAARYTSARAVPGAAWPVIQANFPSRWRSASSGTGFSALWSKPALTAVYCEYALNAVGLVPHMVFLVDFVARGLGQGLDGGARYWVLFGLAATAGPSLTGIMADRVGFRTALQLAFVLQAAAVALPSFWGGPASLAVSSAIVGAFVPGVVPLVLGRVHDLVPPDGEARQAAWGLATAAFALGQAGAAYGFSFLFVRTGSHVPLFQLGAAALVLALVIDLVVSRAAPATSGRAGERMPG